MVAGLDDVEAAGQEGQAINPGAPGGQVQHPGRALVPGGEEQADQLAAPQPEQQEQAQADAEISSQGGGFGAADPVQAAGAVVAGEDGADAVGHAEHQEGDEVAGVVDDGEGRHPVLPGIGHEGPVHQKDGEGCGGVGDPFRGAVAGSQEDFPAPESAVKDVEGGGGAEHGRGHHQHPGQIGQAGGGDSAGDPQAQQAHGDPVQQDVGAQGGDGAGQVEPGPARQPPREPEKDLESDHRGKTGDDPDIPGGAGEQYRIGPQEQGDGPGKQKAGCQDEAGEGQQHHQGGAVEVFGPGEVLCPQGPAGGAHGAGAEDHGGADDELEKGVGDVDAGHGVGAGVAAQEQAVHHALDAVQHHGHHGGAHKLCEQHRQGPADEGILIHTNSFPGGADGIFWMQGRRWEMAAGSEVKRQQQTCIRETVQALPGAKWSRLCLAWGIITRTDGGGKHAEALPASRRSSSRLRAPAGPGLPLWAAGGLR